MRKSGTAHTITNAELTALALAVGEFNKSFKSEWNEKLHKNLKGLEDKLFELVKGNTNTTYRISIQGGETFTKEVEQEIDQLLTGEKSSIEIQI